MLSYRLKNRVIISVLGTSYQKNVLSRGRENGRSLRLATLLPIISPWH